MTAPQPTVEVEEADAVGTIWLARSKVLNAFDDVMHLQLINAMDRLEGSAAVKVIVIRGRGRAFCSGADVRYTRSLHGEAARRYIALDMRSKNRVAASAKPVIAAVHGYALGGGFELALACDVRIATADAIFGLREISIGTIPGSGGLQRLPSLVGMSRAKHWALSGCDVSAQEASAAGLLAAVAEDLDAVLDAYVANLARHSGLALRLLKAGIDPTPQLAPREIAFHELASAALHDDGNSFATRTERFN